MLQLACKELSLGYEGISVADNISFSVSAGDYLCVAGANGSGKSTLIKTILHLQPPIKGSIVLGDGIKPGEIGYLPQQTAVQKDFPASVSEIVLSGCLGHSHHPFYTKENKKLAQSNMERLGISELAKKCYRDLSGGQQQRVLLARALCSAVKMLLLDEPVAGLDPSATQDMYDILAQLNHQGMSIIMVSHDVSGMLKYASHILYLGEMLFFGTKDECVEKGVIRERTGM